MKARLSVVVTALALVVALPPAAGAAQILTSANVTADADGDNEVDIAINPTNSQNLVAAWNDYGNGNSCGVGYSTNGGKTWKTDWLRGMTPAGGNDTFTYGAGDPSVGFLANGTAVVSCAAWGFGNKSQPSAVFVSRSKDGGRTWAPVQQLTYGQNLGHLQDHNMLTIDRYSNRAVVAYTVWNGYAARSYALVSYDATIWSGPYEIAADYKANAVDTFDVSVAGAPDGTLYATSGIWQDVNTWNEQSIVVSQMRPGETAFTHSTKARDLVPAPKYLPNENWRTSMQGSIGVEANGTVDLLTGDYVTGNLDMYLLRSFDHGASFPQQTNLTRDRTHQVMPWLSVLPVGRIDTIFYDYDESTGLMSADYGQIAAGGTTMSRLVLQTGIDGDAQPPRGPGGSPFWGDYIGIDSTPGLVALAWTCNGPRSQDICSATVSP
jgi:hypothetical protein